MNDAAIDPDTIPPPIDATDASFLVLAFFAVAAFLLVVVEVRRRIASGRPVVPAVPHPAALWDGGVVFVVVAMMFASQMFGVAAYDWWAGPAHADGPTISPQRLAAASLSMAAATAVSAVVMLRAGACRRSLGLFSDAPLRDLGLAAASLALMMPPLLVTAGLLNRLVPYEHPIIDLLKSSAREAALPVVVLSAVVVAPLVEEFVFRGVLQGWLEATEAKLAGWDGSLPQPRCGTGFPAGYPGLLAVGGSAMCFALAHISHGLGWIPLIGFGAAVGILRRERGSLLPGVIVHALFNAMSLTLLLLQM